MWDQRDLRDRQAPLDLQARLVQIQPFLDLLARQDHRVRPVQIPLYLAPLERKAIPELLAQRAHLVQLVRQARQDSKDRKATQD